VVFSGRGLVHLVPELREGGPAGPPGDFWDGRESLGLCDMAGVLDTRHFRGLRCRVQDIGPAVTRRLIDRFTGREHEVLTLIGRGLSCTEIAADLTISIATVKTYVTRLLTKLDARDRVQLVIIAYDTGLVTPAQ
jgi:DNA-binding CsgD family transcriptional regulator